MNIFCYQLYYDLLFSFLLVLLLLLSLLFILLLLIRYHIKDASEVTFKWIFEKPSSPIHIQDHVNIYQIEVTNVKNDNIIGCQTCVQGIVNGKYVNKMNNKLNDVLSIYLLCFSLFFERKKIRESSMIDYFFY